MSKLSCCLSCGRVGYDKLGNALCNTEDGKVHLVLERSLYESASDFRKALSECGEGCVKFSCQPLGKEVKSSGTVAVAKPVVAKAPILWGRVGWVFGGCCFAVNIVLLLALLGVF